MRCYTIHLSIVLIFIGVTACQFDGQESGAIETIKLPDGRTLFFPRKLHAEDEGPQMESEAQMRYWENQIEGLPFTECSGPYWVSGKLNPMSGSASR